jgi:hypothetical protein
VEGPTTISGLPAKLLKPSQRADMIRGKTPEQIRQKFGIATDFTPEEEAEIRRE